MGIDLVFSHRFDRKQCFADDDSRLRSDKKCDEIGC